MIYTAKKAAPLIRSCLFNVFFFRFSGKRKSLYRAVRHTLSAADTVRVIAFLYGIEAHGAGLLAGSAIYAGILIKFYAHKCDPVEESVDRTQGADEAAERPEDECGADDDADEDDHLDRKHHSRLCP